MRDFGRSRANPDGLNYYCKICARARQRAWAKANPETVKSLRSAYAKRIHETNDTRDPYA